MRRSLLGFVTSGGFSPLRGQPMGVGYVKVMCSKEANTAAGQQVYQVTSEVQQLLKSQSIWMNGDVRLIAKPGNIGDSIFQPQKRLFVWFRSLRSNIYRPGWVEF